MKKTRRSFNADLIAEIRKNIVRALKVEYLEIYRITFALMLINDLLKGGTSAQLLQRASQTIRLILLTKAERLC